VWKQALSGSCPYQGIMEYTADVMTSTEMSFGARGEYDFLILRCGLTIFFLPMCSITSATLQRRVLCRSVLSRERRRSVASVNTSSNINNKRRRSTVKMEGEEGGRQDETLGLPYHRTCSRRSVATTAGRDISRTTSPRSSHIDGGSLRAPYEVRDR